MTKKEIKGKLLALNLLAIGIAVDTKRQQDELKSTVVRQLDLEVEIHSINDLAAQIKDLADEIEGEVPPADLDEVAKEVPGAVGLPPSPDGAGSLVMGTGNGEALIGQNMGTIAKGDAPLTGEITQTATLGDPPAILDNEGDPPKVDDPPESGSKKKTK